jgi:hypothetical protein
MLELLYEHPLIIGLAGGAATALAIFIWVQAGRKEGLIAGVVCLVLTVGLVLLSINIVTDRERITQLLDEVAAALEVNDHEKVYSYIHPNAVEGVQRARGELPRYVFSEARVTRVREIVVNRQTTPPTAIAEFTVVVNVGFQGMQHKVPRLVRVYFMLRDDRWMVRDYEHTAPNTSGFADEAN